jgi:DNA damage-binding protein 1
MNNVDPDSSPVAPSLIFATASGAIGVVADLSLERFKLLDQMQYNMNRVIKSIGELSHSE